MKTVEHFTVQELAYYFSYDPISGNLMWAVTRYRRKVGDVCGFVNGDGYKSVAIGRKFMLAHRVAWALYHGEWPKSQIDHINRDRTDNRLTNLRLVTGSENCTNRIAKKPHGLRGVTRLKWGRWQAQANIAGVSKYLGSFETKELAHEAYVRYVNECRPNFLPKEDLA